MGIVPSAKSSIAYTFTLVHMGVKWESAAHHIVADGARPILLSIDSCVRLYAFDGFVRDEQAP